VAEERRAGTEGAAEEKGKAREGRSGGRLFSFTAEGPGPWAWQRKGGISYVYLIMISARGWGSA